MNNAQTTEPGSFPGSRSSDTVGGHLGRLRHERRLTIAEAAETTCISAATIQAIENSAYEKLPADPFTRGLIAKYAIFLGTDAESLTEEFFRERDALRPERRKPSGKKANMPLQPIRLAEPVHISSAMVAGLLLLGLIFSFTAFCLYTSWNPINLLLRKNEAATVPFMPLPGMVPPPDKAAVPTPPAEPAIAPREGHNTSVSPQTIPATSMDKTGYPAAEPTYRLALELLHPGQMEVSIDGGIWKKQGVLPGDRLEITAEKSLQLRFDQAEAALLTLNGTVVKFPATVTNGRYIMSIPEDLLR